MKIRAAILKMAAILNLKISEITLLEEITTKSMYYFTLCAQNKEKYDILKILALFWRPFWILLNISKCPKLPAGQQHYSSKGIDCQVESTEKKT